MLLGYAEVMADQVNAAEVEKDVAEQASAPAKAPTEVDDALIPLPSKRRLRGKPQRLAPPAVHEETGD